MIVMLLGGACAAMFGTAVPGGIGTVMTGLGSAAFGAALVLIGMRMWDAEAERARDEQHAEPRE